MFRFEELEIWRLAVAYGRECYRLTDEFPKHEQYSLSDQLRRAGLSVSNNITEGSIGSGKYFKKFINTAIASTLETVNIINFAVEVGYLDETKKKEMYEKAETLIRKMRSFSKTLDD